MQSGELKEGACFKDVEYDDCCDMYSQTCTDSHIFDGRASQSIECDPKKKFVDECK